MKRIQIVIAVLFLIPQLGMTQNDAALSKKEQKENRPKYRGISILGLGVGSFRDFATSPLTYSGLSISSSRFSISMDEHRETEWGSSLALGLFGNNFNDHSSSSIVISPSLYYSELYALPKWSSSKFNLKVGGMVNVTTNVRFNSSLQNNSTGFEMIPTLFGSVKGTLDVSRKGTRSKKFLFLKYTLEKRRKSLSFRFNTGLINASYRNGYAYSGQAFLLNEDDAFDGYQFNIFSGYRLSSAIDYTLYSRKTTNAIQLSYVWDAYKTGGDFDTFEMAQHALRVTLLFNTK